MINVFYFSACGHSRKVAEFCASYLNTKATPITQNSKITSSQTMLVVFPVFCQNIPDIVKNFLSASKTKYASLIAVYGNISFGRVLYEAQKIYRGTIISGAYLPSGHSYLDDNSLCDLNKLVPLLNHMNSTISVKFPKTPKNIFASFFPALRSRIGVKIICSDKCDGCNICQSICPKNAINKGKPDNKCIRCLKCIKNCPQNALSFSLSPAMRHYLHCHKKDKTIIYLSDSSDI